MTPDTPRWDQDPTTADKLAQIEYDNTWRWRYVRSMGFSVGFWPLEWGLSYYCVEDRFGGSREVSFGPFALTLNYNDGSAISWMKRD